MLRADSWCCGLTADAAGWQMMLWDDSWCWGLTADAVGWQLVLWADSWCCGLTANAISWRCGLTADAMGWQLMADDWGWGLRTTDDWWLLTAGCELMTESWTIGYSLFNTCFIMVTSALYWSSRSAVFNCFNDNFGPSVELTKCCFNCFIIVIFGPIVELTKCFNCFLYDILWLNFVLKGIKLWS